MRAGRYFTTLRGDEKRPFVKVELRQVNGKPVGTLYWAGRQPGPEGHKWPVPGDAAQILDWAFEYCHREGLHLRVVINDVEWDSEWGRLFE